MQESNLLIQHEADPLVVRKRIADLEAAMLEEPQVEMPVVHHFAPGVYARELKIPKGTMLTGKIHKTEHLNIVSSGDISVLTENGVKRVQAPHTFVSKPGAKRVGYAHEDTTWTTIHVTNETDLEKIEDAVIAKSHDEVDALSAKTVNELQGEVL